MATSTFLQHLPSLRRAVHVVYWVWVLYIGFWWKAHFFPNFLIFSVCCQSRPNLLLLCLFPLFCLTLDKLEKIWVETEKTGQKLRTSGEKCDFLQKLSCVTFHHIRYNTQTVFDWEPNSPPGIGKKRSGRLLISLERQFAQMELKFTRRGSSRFV